MTSSQTRSDLTTRLIVPRSHYAIATFRPVTTCAVLVTPRCSSNDVISALSVAASGTT